MVTTNPMLILMTSFDSALRCCGGKARLRRMPHIAPPNTHANTIKLSAREFMVYSPSSHNEFGFSSRRRLFACASNGQHFMANRDEAPKLTVVFSTTPTENWFNKEFGPEPLAPGDSGRPEGMLPGKPQTASHMERRFIPASFNVATDTP